MSPVLIDIFQIIGGLGLLLFGMKMMTSGLEIVASDRLHTFFKHATSNRFLAAIIGIIATICINSSTAVTILVVSFVNSRLINLTQAIGVIMGANVGTTFSAQLIAFKIDAIAPLFIFIGIIMYLFFKPKNIKNIGYIILGFGILLFSINVMGSPLKDFARQPAFNNILTTFENPFLALIAGFIFTAIIQSSSATMGLLVTMHLNNVPIPFETSAFIILGTNIGTSLTTLIASIPASRESKRAALFHMMYDIIGSTIFGTLIFNFPAILNWFQATWTESARQVAMFHTLYNTATLFLLISFIKWIALLMQKIIPVKPDEVKKIYDKKLIYLDAQNLQTPSLAVINSHQEICRMGKIANENFALALESFFELDEEKANRTFENEKIVDFLNDKVAPILIKVNNMDLTSLDSEKAGKMFDIISKIEKIGDHAVNIANNTLKLINNKSKFSETALAELRTISDLTVNITNKALEIYENTDLVKLPEIKLLDSKIEKLAKEFPKSHIERLKENAKEAESGVIFFDLFNDLGRITEHAKTIAYLILPKQKKNIFDFIKNQIIKPKKK
jgi:phosphate:Na+ symporter